MKVLLDANFCMLPVQRGIDIFDELRLLLEGELELIVPDFIVSEIKKIKKGAVALQLLKMNNVKILTTKNVKDNDESLLNIAETEGMIIATNDSILRKKCKVRGVRTVYSTKSKTLKMD